MKRKRPESADRRTFLRGLAAAPLLPAALGTASVTELSDAQTAAAPNTAQVDALTEVVRARFGHYLAEGDIEEIKKGIERNIRYADALAKVKLTNADEPDFTFFADGPPQA